MLKALLISALLLNPLIAPAQNKRSTRKPANARTVPLSPRQVAAIVYPSIVSIYVSDASGRHLYAGSGFVVGPHLVATCYHVVSRRGTLTVAAKQTEWPATLYRHDKESDLAILNVPNLTKPSLTLSQRADYYVGDALYTVGDPSGLQGTFSSGIASNFAEIEGVFYIQFTAPISPGSSGGPLVDDRGQVAGIVNMQIREGQNLNFAVFSIHLKALLTGKTVGPSTRIDGIIRP